jgi:hypothetical protein
MGLLTDALLFSLVAFSDQLSAVGRNAGETSLPLVKSRCREDACDLKI